MSSRQLRKLQQQRELEQQAKLQEEQEEESEDEPVVPARSKASLFANLAALEDEAEDEDEEKPEEQAADIPQEDVSDHQPAPASASKKPKKSKKKKKGKNKGKQKPAEEEAHGNGADEIDAALREQDFKNTSSGAASEPVVIVDPEYQRICALLGVNTQHLKVANEMRNLFGKAALEDHDDPGGPTGRGARRRQRGQQRQVDLETALKGQHAPGKGLAEITLRRNTLIQGKDDWPKGTTGGLTMEMVDDKATDGTIEFRYVHDKTYQALQQAFHGYVEMGDPQNLIGLLTRNPYHISLLIQVSKIAKDQGDHALSADLLERALFSFGRAATTLFNNRLAQGKARLDFARPENREFWLAGYQYIKSLIMKGTYRTALEWAKLLLSLDPEADPYCMRLMIHHLALRAHEFQWLMDLYQSVEANLWNVSQAGKDFLFATYHTAPSLAYAAMSLREATKCRALLSDSMNMVPWLFTRLFKELNLDAPKSIWGITPRTDAEALFTELYVLQTKDLWNTPEATSLLMEIAHTIPKVDPEAFPKLPNSEMTLDVVRFIYLDNTPALMALAPSNLLHRSNNSDADPLPPDHNIFSYPAQRIAIEGRDGPRGGLGDDFFDPLAALARLLPGFRRADADNREEYEDAIHRVLEGVVEGGEDNSEDELENEAGDGRAVPVSLARRLLNMLWRSDGAEEEDIDEDARREASRQYDDREFEEMWNSTDGDGDAETDDDMPELIDQ